MSSLTVLWKFIFSGGGKKNHVSNPLYSTDTKLSEEEVQ